MNKDKIYKDIIIYNSQKPNKFSNKKLKNNIMAISISCGDEYQITLAIKNKIIKEILFMGKGCVISKSTINLICNYLENLEIQEAKKFLKNYRSMILNQDFDKNMVKDLIAFETIKNNINRIPCALVGTNTLLEFLEKYETKN